MSGCVMGRVPSFRLAKKKGITDPREPITLPYLTTEKRTSREPFMLLAATNNLSLHNLVAPYRLIGAAALSVDNATTCLTPESKAALITFSAPITLVFIHSMGLYSAAGTCFRAAACIIMSMPSQARLKRSPSLISPIK